MKNQHDNPDIRVFRAKSLHQAIARIRAEFGPTAEIVRTREVPVPGILNRMFGRTEIEITAGPPRMFPPPPHAHTSKRRNGTRASVWI